MIIVMGLPGAGKTTLLKSLTNKEYKIVNYGDLMFEIEKEKFGIENRDDMRKLPIEKQKLAQEMVGKKLAQMGKEKQKYLLDTHCSISTPSGFYPGLPFSLLKDLTVHALVLVTADVVQIQKRREKDSNRVRDKDDVALHDQMNKSYLASYSAFTGAPASIIKNEDGKLQEAINQLEDILRKY